VLASHRIRQPSASLSQLCTHTDMTVAAAGDVGPIAYLKGHYFQLSLSVLSVCLSVCVSLTGTSTLQL